nr:uncharacterized protein LOC102444049 isoform X2 [Pelodiscus sinensis]|eukprot:XP_014426910.1 uncharacterized protein LOC102444049 isoform X2 [Pelodiscus sinensis]
MKAEASQEIQCAMHPHPLELYCKEDQVLLCLVCVRYQVHHSHTVVPRDEAARECRELITELRKKLQSAEKTLALLEGKDGKHRPPRARDTAHKKPKRPSIKIQPLGSERKSISLGKKISTDAESQGQKAKESGEQTSEKVEKTRSHVIHASEEASVPNKEYLDPIIHQISGTTDDAALSQVAVRSLRQRFEGPTSPKESPDSGLRSGKILTPAGLAQTGQVSSTEHRREKAAEKQEAAPSRVGDETPTPQCGVGKTPPELPAPSATPSVGEAEGAQVGVTDLRKRFEGPVSPKDSPDSGLTSWKLGTSSGHTRVVHVGSQEKRREKAAEKQEAAPSRVGDETPTPQCGVGKTPPELPAPSATPAMGEAEGAQVHVTDLRQRFEGHVSGPRGGREMDKTCFSAAGASSTGNGETVPASSVSPWVP